MRSRGDNLQKSRVVAAGALSLGATCPSIRGDWQQTTPGVRLRWFGRKKAQQRIRDPATRWYPNPRLETERRKKNVTGLATRATASTHVVQGAAVW
jgi:hypothetical protein